MNAALCGILATIIFSTLVDKLPSDFSVGRAFNVNIAAWVLGLVASLLLTIDSRNISYVDPREAVQQGGRQMMYVSVSKFSPFFLIHMYLPSLYFHMSPVTLSGLSLLTSSHFLSISNQLMDSLPIRWPHLEGLSM